MTDNTETDDDFLNDILGADLVESINSGGLDAKPEEIEKKTENSKEDVDEDDDDEDYTPDYSEYDDPVSESDSDESKTEEDDKVEEIAKAISSNNVKIDISPPLPAYPILVIDDDRWIQRIFAQYLKSWGFKHIYAATPFEGVNLALNSSPLLIFLDIIMPEVQGDITLKFIKGLEKIKHIPTVIISGNLNKEVLKTTYKDGAVGFISKPFTKDVLFNKIKEVLDPKIYNRMVKDGLINPNVGKKAFLSGV